MILNKVLPFKVLPLALAIGLAGCGEDNIDPEAIVTPETYAFTDIDGNSTVNNADITTLNLLIEELDQLIASPGLQEYGAFQETLGLLERAYLFGTHLNEADSLVNSNLYSNSGATPVTAYDIQNTDFSELTPDLSIQSFMPGIHSPIPIRKPPAGLMEEDVTEEEMIGDFLGWSDSDYQPDGDKTPDSHISTWLEDITSIATDGDPDTQFIKNNRNYRLIVINFLKVAIPYFQLTNNLLTADNFENAKTFDFNEALDIWDAAFALAGFPIEANKYDYSNLTETANLTANTLNEALNSIPDGLALDSLFATYDSPLLTENYFQKLYTKFLEGRVLISSDDLEFSEEDRKRFLFERRKDISLMLEKVMIATVIAHMNNTIIEGDNLYKTKEITENYINHWSKLKVYALALQFNPDTLLDYDSLKNIHGVIGTAPPGSNAIRRIQTDLLEYRDTFQETYNFSERDVKSWGISWSQVTY